LCIQMVSVKIYKEEC